MRIGVMLGPERGRYATKVERLQADARWAEEAGMASVWIPQIPDDFDALTAATLVGAETEPHRDRHRRRAGAAAPPDRPGPAGAVGAGRLRGPPRPGPRRLAPLGDRRDARACPTSTSRPPCGPTSTCSTRPWPGPGMVDVENDYFRVHNPLDITDVAPTPVLLAALGPMMLRLAGERTDGTILWMADERAIGSHVVPNITRAAESAGRPAPRVVAGIPVCLCGDDEIDVAVARTNRVLSEAEISPNYQRLLDHGDAREVGDILVAGQRVDDREAPPCVRRRRRHRRIGAGRADRRGPRRADRLVEAHPGAALVAAASLTSATGPKTRQTTCTDASLAAQPGQ